MVSISSKSAVSDRTKTFWKKEKIWMSDTESNFDKISFFLNNEYKTIPDKERIGKGRIFIAKIATEECLKLLNHPSSFDFIDYTSKILEYAERKEDIILENFAVLLLAESVTISEEKLFQGLEKAKEFATSSSWEIRELSAYSIRKGMKIFPDQTLSILREWLSSYDDENIRRVIAESLRPLSDIKWLRNPEKNDIILDILTEIRSDPSEYVRKSVGNNLKDLSKYMPEKILDLAGKWIKDSNIAVEDDLASKTKKQLGKEDFYLVWTLKHALRWLRERNPEYHKRMEIILGKNYVLYYNEKKNKLAKPK
ncbi:MAG: hypothetical protein ACXADA_11475 [Candidatus Hodarchaeales archaeon]